MKVTTFVFFQENDFAGCVTVPNTIAEIEKGGTILENRVKEKFKNELMGFEEDFSQSDFEIFMFLDSQGFRWESEEYEM